MNKSLRGHVRPGRRHGLAPLAKRLTTLTQRIVRSEKIARRAEEREAARLLASAKSRRRKKEKPVAAD